MPGGLIAAKRALLGSTGTPYSDKVLGTEAANLLAYWRLQEASGTDADNYEGTAARDGTYTGVTLGQTGIGDGLTCPLFDGANDYVDIYSISLRDAFDGATGTLAIWGKVSGVGVWSDDTIRRLVNLRVNSDNFVQILKRGSGSDDLRWSYKAGGTQEDVDLTTTTTDWFHAAITWSVAADEVKAYFNGSQTGSTQTGLGTWVGSIVEDGTNIGALTETPTFVWDGYLAHWAVWTKALTAAQISSLASL